MLTYRPLNLIFRALANHTRRHLFEQLCDDENYVTALTEPLPITRQAVLQHLAVLERNGLIHTEKHGTVVWCRIEPHALSLLEQWLSEHRGYYARRQAMRARLK